MAALVTVGLPKREMQLLMLHSDGESNLSEMKKGLVFFSFRWSFSGNIVAGSLLQLTNGPNVLEAIYLEPAAASSSHSACH
jgi:hypothetical protein